MAHNIFGDRFYSVRKPAWHYIGTVVPDHMPAKEAVKLIGADFQLIKAQSLFTVKTIFGDQSIVDPNKFVITREPTEDSMVFPALGHCGPEFEIIQRPELAEALDKLTERWPLETVGILGDGETVFFVLDAGDVEIGGELVHQYFMIYDKVDGGTSLKISFTPVRAECQNTCVTALKQATITAALSHRQGIGKHVEFRIDVLNEMAKSQLHTVDFLERMAQTVLSDVQIKAVFAAAYPYPNRPAKVDLLDIVDQNDPLLAELWGQGSRALESQQYYNKRAEGFRAGADWCLNLFNEKHPELANTAWATYNAVTETADWRNGSDSIPVSLLFGTRAKEKKQAFGMIQQILG